MHNIWGEIEEMEKKEASKNIEVEEEGELQR